MKNQFTFCSFATTDRFLGGLLLDGWRDPIEAAAAAYQLGLHPGGEMMVWHAPDDLPDAIHAWHRANLNRLLTETELKESPVGASVVGPGVMPEDVNSVGVIPE